MSPFAEYKMSDNVYYVKYCLQDTMEDSRLMAELSFPSNPISSIQSHYCMAPRLKDSAMGVGSNRVKKAIS